MTVADRRRHLTAAQAEQVERLRRRLPELSEIPLPGSGATGDRWTFLSAVAGDDLAHARLVEGHLDAVAILHELGRADAVEPADTWGVWAAQPSGIVAELHGGRWTLRGTKGWCSGSVGLDRALVTATAADGPRLFAIDTTTVDADPDSWDPIGMAATASHTISVDTAVDATSAIGGPGAYVNRPGFWHGGIGVAACWYGGATAVLSALAQRVHDRSPDGPPDDAATAALGRATARLDAAGSLLERVAIEVDEYPADADRARRNALTTRLAVEDAARSTLDIVSTALGAGALCVATAHSRRVADLTVYLRQLDVAATATAVGRLAALAVEPVR